MTGHSVRVLLVEDNPGDARLITEMLNEPADGLFSVKHVSSAQEALRVLMRKGEEIQVVLLDLGLPDETGLHTLRRIAPAADDICLIIITTPQNEEVVIAALKEGAQDYFFKGQMDAEQLRRVIRYGMERHRVQSELRNLSLQDPLTGLHNRHGFLVLAEQQMKISRRNLSPSLLLFLDLDGLKRINDALGHDMGTRAILEFTGLLRGCLRQCDILARLSGDEFAALILGASESAEPVIRAKLQKAVEELNSRDDRPYALSFSVGVALCDPRKQVPVTDLLKQADMLMYAEKRKHKGARRRSTGRSDKARSQLV